MRLIINAFFVICLVAWIAPEPALGLGTFIAPPELAGTTFGGN